MGGGGGGRGELEWGMEAGYGFRDFSWEIFKSRGGERENLSGKGGEERKGVGEEAGVNSDCLLRCLRRHYRLPPLLSTK